MVQPVHPITEPPALPRAQVRSVAPEAVAAAYKRLFPAEVTNDEENLARAREWMKAIEENPAFTIGQVGKYWKPTLALFNALDLPAPKTEAMALFVFTNPDLETQKTQLVYVSARTPWEENVDLIVRAVSQEHAEIAWREYYVDWDLPDHPHSITPIPVDGAPGAISWSVLAPEVEDDSEDEDEGEAEAPGV
jgi:hypothetical protein